MGQPRILRVCHHQRLTAPDDLRGIAPVEAHPLREGAVFGTGQARSFGRQQQDRALATVEQLEGRAQNSSQHFGKLQGAVDGATDLGQPGQLLEPRREARGMDALSDELVRQPSKACLLLHHIEAEAHSHPGQQNPGHPCLRRRDTEPLDDKLTPKHQERQRPGHGGEEENRDDPELGAPPVEVGKRRSPLAGAGSRL